MKKNSVFVFVVCVFATVCFPAGRAWAQQKDFDTVRTRILNEIANRMPHTQNDREAATYLETLKDDGTWPDINYKDPSRTVWSPATHLSRVLTLALAFSKPDSKYSHSLLLNKAIVSALSAWDKMDPRCTNWWYNDIACPQLLGQILLLLKYENALPNALTTSLMKKMERGDMYKETGANKFDVALHNLYSAVLKQDRSLMDAAVKQCFQPICLTTASEGLQYDYAYFQHGPQLQIASYGTVFVTGEYRVASYVCGTHWQLPQTQWQILNTYLDHTFLNVIRYKYLDFNVMGRAFSRKDAGIMSAVSSLQYNMNVLKGYYPSGDFERYDDALNRATGKMPPFYAVKPVFIPFWKGDYALQTGPGYLFSVRTNSIRTSRTETGNKENLYGRYMSDGATAILRRGDEYFNIYPLWEYDKIPGVTCRQYLTDRPAKNAWEQPGTTNFTGAVGNGPYGVSTYTLNYDSVQAKKAWFFFDGQIICLGAGINSTAPENITTTVNQCWSRGYLPGNTAANAYWQDSVGYYFQPGEKVFVSDTIQKGTWRHINSSQSADTVFGKVFKIWLDHGNRPIDASYAYAIIPNLPAKGFVERSPFLHLSVIINNSKVQAVCQPEKQLLETVFYQPGTIQAGNITISVSQPCILIMQRLPNGSTTFSIADPTHLLKEIVVELNHKKINCPMPSGPYAGSAFRYPVK